MPSLSPIVLLCVLQVLLLVAINTAASGKKSHSAKECASRRDTRLKGQTGCCQLVPYCRCLKFCPTSDKQCQGEVKQACDKSLLPKCKDYNGPKSYSQRCSGEDWEVLLNDDWSPKPTPAPASSGSSNGGRAVLSGKLSPAIIGGVVVLIVLFLVFGVAAYCWCLGPKKKTKGSKESSGQAPARGQQPTAAAAQPRSSVHKTRDATEKGKKTKKTKGGAATAAAAAKRKTGDGSSDPAESGNFGKSRSKRRSHSGAARARGTTINSDTEKNLSAKQKSGKGVGAGASKVAGRGQQGGSSFNSRQVHTVDLKNTAAAGGGGKGRVPMRYTKFRNALKPTKTT